MSWFKYLMDRSAVAKWLFFKKTDGDSFRLKDICIYKGKENDTSGDPTANEIDRDIDVRAAHKITNDLIQMDIIRPTIDSNKVERFVVNKSGNDKKLKRLIGWRILPIISLFFKWLFSKLKDILLWLITVLAALGVKEFFS